MKVRFGTLSNAQSEKRRDVYLLITEGNFAFYFLLTRPLQVLVPHRQGISEASLGASHYLHQNSNCKNTLGV